MDRAAILAGGDVRTALRALLKVAVGARQFESVREEEFIEQCRKAHRKMSRLQVWLIVLRSTTPPLVLRLVKMIKWGGLPAKK